MTRFLSFGAVVALSLAPVVAAQNPQAAKEQFHLQFEISKNGTVVAQPVLTLETGSAGTIALNDGLTFIVMPARIDANTVRITCDIKIENARPQLRFNLPGSGSITVGGDSFDIKVAVAP